MLVKDDPGTDQVVASGAMIVVVEIELGENGCIGRPVQGVVGGGLQLPGQGLVAKLCRLLGISQLPMYLVTISFLSFDEYFGIELLC